MYVTRDVSRRFYEEPTLQICTLVFPRSETIALSLCFTVPAIFFTCLLPMSLLVYHYQRIFHKLLKTRKRWATTGNLSHTTSREECSRKISLQQIVHPHRHHSLTQHEELRLKKHVRAVRILLLNVLVVLNMWLPITVVMFLIYVDGKRPTEDTGFFLRSHHFIWALLVAYLNTLVNPILYGLLSENFRACFTRLWFLSRRRKRACKSAFSHQDLSKHVSPNISRSQPPEESKVADKTPRQCYHLSCSDNTNDRQKSSNCSRHFHSFPGSSISLADVPSTVTILKS